MEPRISSYRHRSGRHHRFSTLPIFLAKGFWCRLLILRRSVTEVGNMRYWNGCSLKFKNRSDIDESIMTPFEHRDAQLVNITIADDQQIIHNL
ncbi:unnamed protein product [Clonostachys solani]|uniref:Uncharacterized protein n=1 Tax=Clonostachys solani TaxID=160281 RepID=A0A9P0EKI3_9HYPO|nr:unnamed protein product [Clonostachys solani]